MVNYDTLQKASKEELIGIIKKLDEGTMKAFEKSQRLVEQNSHLEKGIKNACDELVAACKKLKTNEKFQSVNYWKRKILSN